MKEIMGDLMGEVMGEVIGGDGLSHVSQGDEKYGRWKGGDKQEEERLGGDQAGELKAKGIFLKVKNTSFMTSGTEALKVPYVPAAYIKYILYVLAVYYLNEADPQYDQPNSSINLIN